MKKVVRTLANNSQYLVIALGAVMALGLILSGLTTDDPRWMGWSLSRLGEGFTLSSSFFNGAILIAAAILWRIGAMLSKNLKTLKNREASIMSRVAFYGLSICMVGVAMLPNDIYHAEHLFFARGLLVIFGIYMVAFPMTLPKIGRKAQIVAYGMPILAIIMTIRNYITRTMPFVLYEIIFGVVAVIWLFLFCYLIELRVIDQAKPDRSLHR